MQGDIDIKIEIFDQQSVIVKQDFLNIVYAS